ncbi:MULTISPECIES: DUF2510 domain-containing protein [Streptomyces]|uniref:DUF2510 domain-containing protein n=1 Tax=Streptomyces caniscabiei TaxID=2746961 RepID=A0ABU4MKE9_9ACTN|nr:MULTISPECIES: DUF2510 domain-containing protein [Streptomyces]MBE4736577.1 DUF2510 domain-containing protein [Streptomyces caniscabiei]MBE4761877.1 DUF2510 domain-containing protein [Streptomyces caniscabiei]MBE4770501.1 DUF2510 domain-containing protein [Streptomyces caniscabiei]MBE4786396.1 DUF2510 domain-containing protein [Streptomyces caniscabiei]MBE4796525.1 DUF2510 domain-containing protein [Streptomyces caniscabiei]
MSSSPPPGWYRDPSFPLTERWWDGTTWTDHRRQPEQPVPPLPQPGSPARRGPGRTKVVALAAVGAVLVAGAVTGGVLLLGEDGDAGRETRTTTASPTSEADGKDSPAPTESAGPSPSGDAKLVVDDLNGITFPIPDGWENGDRSGEDDAVLVTDGTFDCPGEGSVCRGGVVVSRTVTGSDETSPKVLAENDVEDAAKDAFDRNGLDQQPYDGITGHEVVGSGSVAVAGRAGYYVRWRVTTGAGSGGYVQSLVFPSSSGSGAPVLVRFALDAGAEGPPLDDIDEIVEGIRPAGDTDSETGGGVGSSLGPS